MFRSAERQGRRMTGQLSDLNFSTSQVSQVLSCILRKDGDYYTLCTDVKQQDRVQSSLKSIFFIFVTPDTNTHCLWSFFWSSTSCRLNVNTEALKPVIFQSHTEAIAQSCDALWKWQGHSRKCRKFHRLEPAHAAQAVIFWVKVLKTDL